MEVTGTPGPGVGKASRMPGTPHLRGHTYVQSCASAMWVVSALQVSASLRISLCVPHWLPPDVCLSGLVGLQDYSSREL